MSDQGAEFDSFVRDAHARLYRAARLLLRNGGEAEDLVQETLIRTFRAWGQIHEAEAAYAYAYRTLVRLVQRHSRRAWMRREVATNVMPERELQSGDHGTEDRESLQRALRALPAGQRTTAVLRFYLDLSVEQAAEAMGCSVGTVKSQTSKALSSLRIAMADAAQVVR